MDTFLESTSSMVPLIPEDPPDNVTDQCYSVRSHGTVLQGLPFGGVPTVLAINFLVWLVRPLGGAVGGVILGPGTSGGGSGTILDGGRCSHSEVYVLRVFSDYSSCYWSSPV